MKRNEINIMILVLEAHENGLYALHPSEGVKKEYTVYSEDGEEVREFTEEELAEQRARKEKAREYVISILEEYNVSKREFLEKLDNDSLYYYVCGIERGLESLE
jgi:hypothetical protein